MSEQTPTMTRETMTRFTKGMERKAELNKKYAAERTPITTHGRSEKEARERLERREAQAGFIDGKVVSLATLIDQRVDETGSDVFVAHDETGNEVTGIVRVEKVTGFAVPGVHAKEGVEVTYERPSSRSQKRQVTTFRFGNEGMFTVSHQSDGKLENGMPNPFDEAESQYEGGLGARVATPDYGAPGSSIVDQKYKSIFDESQLQQVSFVVAEAVGGIESVLQNDMIESQKSLEERGLPVY